MHTNVVLIDQSQRYTFKVETVWVDWFINKKNEQIKKQFAVICLVDK